LSELRYHLDLFAHALKSAGITHAVISPGSRNAPIVAGLIRVGGFELLSAPDERAAAFMALGAAQATGRAAAVICTSGTAALNLYPGICEAYYQRIPLLAITADRPAALLDQWDGQTIRQDRIFEKHSLANFTLSDDLHKKGGANAIIETVLSAVSICHGHPHGPVHINVPLSEPIYENLDAPLFSFPEINPPEIAALSNVALPSAFLVNKKILVLAGQSTPNPEIAAILNQVAAEIPVLADVLSNIPGENIIRSTELIDANEDLDCPDILLTIGLGIVSKSLKMKLRQFKGLQHFHLGDGGFTGDPFFTSPVTLHGQPSNFLRQLAAQISQHHNPVFLQAWKSAAKAAPDTEEEALWVDNIVKHVSSEGCLQLGNSMAVRFANRLQRLPKFVFGNRGTSGIDGSVSTAVGYAWANPEKHVTCVTGDIGFLYDKNALWCNPLPANITIIVLNNGGGMIFDRLHGPEKLPQLRPFTNTPHSFTAKDISIHYNIPYTSLKGLQTQKELPLVMGINQTQIIEIFTT
jgi:2-succinyl-5-enolpyruvyl-6-hydroxy-3-cyclohexene-1-carboxylate synthase